MAMDMHLPEIKNPPVVIFIHGFKGFKDWGHFPLIGNVFADNGFAFIRFNLSHNGTTIDRPDHFDDLETFAENNLIKELDDVRTMVDGIASGTLFPEHSLDRDTILIAGHSRGGGLSLISAAEDDRIKALATWASVDHFDRGGYPLERWKKNGSILIPNARTGQRMPMNWQFVETLLENADRLSIEKASVKINVPTLIAHGTDDPTVPITEAENLITCNSYFKLLKIEGADHTFGGRHPLEEPTLSEHMELVVDATINHFKAVL